MYMPCIMQTKIIQQIRRGRGEWERSFNVNCASSNILIIHINDISTTPNLSYNLLVR